MRDNLTKEWVKEKSISCNRSFANVLRDVMLEDLLFRTIPNEKPFRFILEKDDFLTKPQLEKLDRVICLCCNAEVYLAKEEFLSRIEQSFGEIEWDVIDQDVSTTNAIARVMLEGSLEEMRVPLVVEIKSREDEPIHIDFKSYQGILNRLPLEYCICAPEQALADQLYQILGKLELIGAMDCYNEAYLLLEKETIEGRKVVDELKLRFANKNSLELLARLKEYQDYKYMEKRWISYQKNQSMLQKKKFETEWKVVLNKITSFLEPILESVESDTVFIGDWMPDLGRFI